MRDPIHTTEIEVIYTHAYVHADIPNTNTRAHHLPLQHIRIYDAQTYALIRAGYLLTRVFGVSNCRQALQQCAVHTIKARLD
jgi:hypothetical protein